jgi:GT2 family glycosyltransferase
VSTETVAFEPKKTKITASPPIILDDITTEPVSILSADGSKKTILKLDEIDQTEGSICLSLWSTHRSLAFCIAAPDEVIPCEVTQIARPDVEEFLGQHADITVQGYRVTVALSSEQLEKKLFLTFNFNGRLYASELQIKRTLSITCDIKKLELTNSSSSKAHIDFCGAIPGKVGILSGWSIAKPRVKLWLVDSRGRKKNLSSCLRFHRDDISKLFKSEYSAQTVYGGFVTDWQYPQEPGDSIAVVEEDDGVFKMIAKVSWDIISDDPVSYAEFSFRVPIPAQDFNTRLNDWEGEAINSLIQERNLNNRLAERSPVIWRFGTPDSKKIKYSVIIPLYGRWDFVEHQLSSFAKDPVFNEKAEIIYVIDDPALITPLVNEAESLFNLYRVPFTIIWGHRNRGFSGANNLGVKHSNGEKLILLNSDVFPNHTGWIESLCNCLDENTDYGMIGAKLLFPDGSVQHRGMQFVYSESWSVWLNKHPLAGLDPRIDNADVLTEKPAVTGACLAINREIYDKIGGFDEGYLIGDFEDSDLCLKVHAEGLKIGYLPSAILTHLERQSFTLLGDTSFRTLVVRFNAWRHSKKWASDIAQIMKKFKSE